MPKISIIIPVYGVEQYLPQCLDSILTQSFTDYEVILVDDCSKDNSGKICDQYAAKDSRIRVIHKKRNEDWAMPAGTACCRIGRMDLICGLR